MLKIQRLAILLLLACVELAAQVHSPILATPPLPAPPVPVNPDPTKQTAPSPKTPPLPLTGRIAPNTVLVKFQDPKNPPRDAVTSLLGLTDMIGVGGVGFYKLTSKTLDVPALVTALAARNDVIRVEPDYYLGPASSPCNPNGNSNTNPKPPDDPCWTDGSLYGLSQIAANSVWISPLSADVSRGSPSVVVGVVDTGVELNYSGVNDLHPDLGSNLWSASSMNFSIFGIPGSCNSTFYGFDATAWPSGAYCHPQEATSYYHGTHVTGIIGARGMNGTGVAGVNWTSSLMTLKYGDGTQTGLISGSRMQSNSVSRQRSAIL